MNALLTLQEPIPHIDGLAQNCNNSIAKALELV